MNAPSRRRRVRPSSSSAQTDLFASPSGLPEGFRYCPDVLSPKRKRRSRANWPAPVQAVRLSRLSGEPPGGELRLPLRLRPSRRRRGRPFPSFLVSLRQKIAETFDRPADAFRQVLINEYRPGAGIGWHRDKAQFDEVVGVSLLAPCVLRFRGRRATLGTERRFRRAALGLSPIGARPRGLGAQHSGSRPPSLFNHLADARWEGDSRRRFR